MKRVRPAGTSKRIGPSSRYGMCRTRRGVSRGGAVLLEPLRLKIRRVRTADVGPFVPVEPEPPQALDDPRDHVPGRSLGVRVLDAQDERAAMAAREEPVEERRARAADVQITGRRRREANANHPFLRVLCRSLPQRRGGFEDDHDVGGELGLPRNVHVEPDETGLLTARHSVRVDVHEGREHSAVEPKRESAMETQLDATAGANREPDLVVAPAP